MIALRSFLAILAMFSGPLVIILLGMTGNLKFSSTTVIVILVINILVSLILVVPRLVQAGFTGLGGRNFYEEICVSLFESSEDANVIIADGKFIECNPATVKQLKCARKEEALSIHPSQISPEYQPDGQRSDEKANKMIGTALSQGFNRFEWVHVRKNGEKFPVVVTLVPSMVAGSQVVLVYWHDIADLNQARESQKKVHDEQKKALQQIAGDFEAGVKSVVDSVSEAVEHLRNNAKGLSATAGEANERSAAVAGASEQASMNVERVAGASEELSATVRNIGHHVNESSGIAASAVQEALRTNQTVAGLTEAAQKIGDVVKLINDIASQTNLLALNATIEAARAGDAGKGFAVVAGEVKNLANQTARATEEIQGQVAQMQSVTATVVDAIKTISGTIDRMNNITQTITGMVEEQSKAANEISKNIQDTALRTRDVSDNIGTVSQAAGETGQLANGLMLEADALAAQANRLHEQVNNFMRRVRSA